MNIKKSLIAVSLSVFTSVGVFSQDQIVPAPVSINVMKDGMPIILKDKISVFVLSKDINFIKEGKLLEKSLSNGTGLPIVSLGENSQIIINKDETLSKYGAGAYSLSVISNSIRISAADDAGVFYAGQTLRQMLPVDFFDINENKKNIVWEVAESPCQILDYPRFGWRCVHLDEARHFFGVESVKRILDQMALLKMNTFHWHLTDDVGWRIEIKKYPRLTEIGSKRADTEIITWRSGKLEGKPHSGFYTQEQIKEIVAYAAERHITIVPEIEMPGHAAAASVAYPYLSLKAPKTVPVTFIENIAFDPTSERTYEFLSDVLDEVVALFPSEIIHIGGDEVRYNDQWKGEPKIDEFMKKNGIKSFGDLHLYFSNRMSKIVAQKGRRMMGWNEIFGGADVNNDGAGKTEDSLDQNAVIHFWKGNAELAKKAIRAGHDIVNSTHNFTYLDYGYGSISLEKAYNFEPIWNGLEEKYHKHILGIGCQMWTEWVPNQDRLDYQMFPRVVAYAEVGWSQKDKKDFGDFKRRMKKQAARMDIQGIKYAKDAVNVISKADFFNTPKAGIWSPKTLVKGNEQIFDVSSLVKSAGKYQVTFFFDRGAHAVDIKSAVILENGKEIAKDIHNGFSGNAKRNITYTLNVPSVKENVKYELLVFLKGSGGNDSYGDIFVQVP